MSRLIKLQVRDVEARDLRRQRLADRLYSIEKQERDRAKPVRRWGPLVPAKRKNTE